jgi:hypothetical protein
MAFGAFFNSMILSFGFLLIIYLHKNFGIFEYVREMLNWQVVWLLVCKNIIVGVL